MLIALPRQQWLHERASSLRYTYSASLGYCCLQVVYYFQLSLFSGFGGLEVSKLTFGIQVRGFKPGRSRRIFRKKKSS